MVVPCAQVSCRDKGSKARVGFSHEYLGTAAEQAACVEMVCDMLASAEAPQEAEPSSGSSRKRVAPPDSGEPSKRASITNFFRK